MKNLLENLPKRKVTPDLYKELPETAGVYLYFRGDAPIYIGKAINLKRRVSSYFDLRLEPKTARMMREAENFSFIKVTSELEALLLEAKLIRKYMPQYNIEAKDDKHPLYIVITKEEYPRVITARKSDLKKVASKGIYGPFPSSKNVRSVLRHLRRIFPFSDHKIGKRPCLYSHIGLCKPCPNEISAIADRQFQADKRRQYLSNIRHLKTVLDGKIENVRREIAKEMKSDSEDQDYEAAAEARDRIKRLEYITQPQIPTEYFIENPNLYSDLREKEIKLLRKVLEKENFKTSRLKRIECFDIAHLAGTNPTASMVTFIDAEPEKKFYRHFKVRQQKGNSDVDSLREVIKRRIKHLEDWGRPDLIIVDGGKPQVGVFVKELTGTGIPIVGLAKRFETLVIPFISEGSLVLKEKRLPRGPALNLVQRLRDEAHRFARVYHHKLVSSELQVKIP